MYMRNSKATPKKLSMANKPTKRLHHKNLKLNHKNSLINPKDGKKKAGRLREQRTDGEIEKLQPYSYRFKENVLNTLIKEIILLDKKSKTQIYTINMRSTLNIKTQID